MTASTIPVLILIALLWWRAKGELLPIVLFCSIFDAASAVNVGGSPVSPWVFALAICLPIKIFTGRLRWKAIPGLNRPAFYALLFFMIYAVFSSVAFPFLFHGIYVSNARNGLNTHLTWTFSNFAQPCYLIAAFTVFLISIHSTREQLRSAIDWYIRASVTLALFSMYQLLNAIAHIPYPSAVLYSNTTHKIYSAYKIGGLWRLNSTLPEASGVAFFLGIGIALLGWHLATHRIRLKSAAGFLLMLTAMVLTVSTLGYACLGTVIAGGILMYARYSFGRQGVAPVKMILLLTLAAVLVPALLLTDLGPGINKVFQSVFIAKVDSDSYRERSLWNTLALQTSHDSYYFGAGWGSVRASSFACSLMGNVGIPGTLLFVAFLLQLGRPLLRPRQYVRFEMFERSLLAIVVMLVGLVVAGSDPITPMSWVLFAVAAASKPRRVRSAPPLPSTPFEAAQALGQPVLMPRSQ